MMKFIPFLTLIFIFLSSTPIISAHFFPNISSIPRSLIPNTSVWDKFNKFAGCRYGQNQAGLSQLKQYFQRFGYINLNDSHLNFTDDFDDALQSAVKVYQRNFNLNATGDLDPATLLHIVRPRCGNADIVNGTTSMNSGKPASTNSAHIHAVEHYSFFPGQPMWRKAALTYAFLPDNQVEDVVRTVFANAFDRWSEVTPLTFTETADYADADIKIGVYRGDHGDGEAFDGVLGTLAHAFSPPSGRLHLDGDENWVVNGDSVNMPVLTSGVDLESVAVHEIGHLLGLGHSSDESAIMYPSIESSTRKVELTNDDVQGIQVLYGSNPDFNGSLPTLTPSGQDETGGAPDLTASWILLMVGLLGLYCCRW